MNEQYKCGYCGFLINTYCENFLEHECFKHYDEALHKLVADDSQVLTIVEKTTEGVVEANDKGPWEELLIKYVQDRPPLYNIKIPVAQRTNLKKNALWNEIYNKLGGKISTEDIKIKWKYLRDCYLKAKKKVTKYKPSGSAATAAVEPGFRFYHLMRFLDDSLDKSLTVSSVAMLSPQATLSLASTSNGEEHGQEQHEEALQATSSAKRKKPNEKDIQKVLLDALATEPPKMDGTDGFLLKLGESLRRLPYREKCRLEIDILNLVYERELQLHL